MKSCLPVELSVLHMQNMHETLASAIDAHMLSSTTAA